MAILSSSKRLKKELTFFNIYTIATGATIASGFFLLPGLAFAQAGPAMILSYILAVIPVIPALFSAAELSTAMPRAGGVYFFLDRSMGPLMGTVGGIGTWLALVLKTAFALVGIGVYMNLFIPQIQFVPIAVGFAILFGIINLLGAKKSGMFQTAFVVGLLLLLTWFLGTGVFSLNFNNFQGLFDQDMHAVFSTAGLVYVSYIGLSQVASVSEEVKRPEKNIPLAMFLALGTAVVVYLVGTVVMIGAIPANILRNNLTPVATAAEYITGYWGAVIMTVAAIFAFFSVANAGILSCSRYPLAMSRDHLFPSFFRKLTKQRTPANSIILTVAIVIIFLLLFDPIKIAKLAGAFQLMLFSLMSLAVIIMRESRIESYDPGFRSPLYPWIQILGIIAPIWLIIEMGWLASIFSLSLILLGGLWYMYYGKGKIAREGAIYHIFARLGQRQFEGLDSELRSILKEKGLRDHDPFDSVVAGAKFIDIDHNISFEKIVERASQALSQKISVEPEILKKSFMEGTQVGATPVSHGAALPHLRLPGIEHSEMVIVRCKAGTCIDLESNLFSEEVSRDSIYAFFFLASPEDNPGQHLRILAQIATHVDDETFLEKWRSAGNEQDVKEVLLRDDRYLSLLLESDKKTSELIDMVISHLNLPEGSLIAIIHRQGEIIIPRGRTVLEEFDRLTIIGYPDGIKDLYTKYIEE